MSTEGLGEALIITGRSAQSAIIDLDNAGDTRVIKSMTWDPVDGLTVQLADGVGVTSADRLAGQPGQCLVVPPSGVCWRMAAPAPVVAPEAKKASK